MKCSQCGHELDEHGVCGYCAGGANVRVLSREEKNSYRGVTIEEVPRDGEEAEPRFYRQDPFGRAGIHIHRVNLGAGRSNWLNWLIGGIVLTVIFGIVLFVALPIALVLAAVAVVVWVVLGFFRGM